MGYMRHHAIIVTTWSEESIKEAHAEATKIFPWVSPISPPAVNGYCSFFIPPDGSKEGWQDSTDGDKRRLDFISWLSIHKYDGSAYFSWAEVQYGDEDGHNCIVQTDDEVPEGP